MKDNEKNYKNQIKSSKAVSLVVLTITIIVLIIIASVTAIGGKISIDKYKDNVLESEIRIVQTAVLNQYEKYITLKDEKFLIGTSCDEKGEINSENTEYKLLTKQDQKTIGIENPKDTYIVNYKTGEVINKDTLKSDGTILKLDGIK